MGEWIAIGQSVPHPTEIGLLVALNHGLGVRGVEFQGSLVRAATSPREPWFDGEVRLDYEFCYKALDDIRKPAETELDNILAFVKQQVDPDEAN